MSDARKPSIGGLRAWLEKRPLARYGLAKLNRHVVAADVARPGMKLQATATTAFFPAALAAASISLALLLLPSAAVPAHSSGVAPALKLVAGAVVAAVEAPVHAIGRARQPEPAVSHATRTAIPATIPSRSTSVASRTAPAHRWQAAHTRVPRPHPVKRTLLTTHSAPRAPASPAVKHGHGKAHAWGRLKKVAAKATPGATGAAAQARVDSGHGKALGRLAGVPPGLPAVPPGQAKKAPASDTHAAPRGHGGGE